MHSNCKARTVCVQKLSHRVVNGNLQQSSARMRAVALNSFRFPKTIHLDQLNSQTSGNFASCSKRKILRAQSASGYLLQLRLLLHRLGYALSAILFLLFILISPTTSPTSPAPASCTPVTSAASDPCFTLRLPPPSPPPSSILD